MYLLSMPPRPSQRPISRATGWAMPMLIPEKKEDKNASANDLDIIKSTLAIVMSWKDTEAKKEGEAFTKFSGEESLYEMHIQPMIRACWAGVRG